MAKEEYGVLLYYKFASITDLDALFSFYDSNCTSLGLLGRVRLSANGVNVTVGGLLSSLEQHIAAVKSNSLFQGTDFKLASCLQPLDRKVAHECGFTSLSIRIVKELVTFSPHPSLKLPEVSSAGKHLSAVEFHSVIQNASGLMVDESHDNGKQVVLLDARNLYETRIGKFSVSTVKTLDPEIRQYSDLSSWIDNNAEQLRGKHILMYCTGGIRCEMASAYVRTKGVGFENVFQLFGGIQRYLEQFPDGGFFKGKNFVFDHRISVGSSETHVIGACLLCKSPFDDYTSRRRCTKCRMLVLICDTCQVKDATYICELCQKHGPGERTGTVIPGGDCKSTSITGQNAFKAVSSDAGFPSQLSPRDGNGTPRKLRILCLHGFRQNGSSFKGRTASLAKKLKNIATLVFVNAPHELPFIYQHRSGQCGNNPSGVQHSSPPQDSCNRKYAWLISPDFSGKGGIDWNVADHPFDRLQYQGQTDGFDVSLEYLKKVFHQEGPFDGILGFSQGAAMTALICAQREKLKIDIDFRFVILCSGYAVRTLESVQGGIACPSLHVFGSDPSKDNQISSEVSRNLASFFEQDSRVVVEHEFGHIIPTRSPYIDRLKAFLERFQ